MNSSYKKYIQSLEWKSFRAAKILHRKGRCKICHFVSSSNDVHHNIYRGFGIEKISDTTVLCRPCHEIVHQILKSNPELSKIKNPFWRWHLVRQKIKKIPDGIGWKATIK